VAIGLLVALRLSGRGPLRAEVAELLGARGLPLTFTGASVDEVLELVERDKKRAGGRVPFVLVQAPGEVSPGHRIDPGDLRAAIEEVRSE
jgi:3-dehydroquinate synthetase